MIIKTSVSDLYVASDLLFDISYRRDPSPEANASRRVADWLIFVAEQREEYEARKRTEKQRFPSLKSGMETIWKARREAA